jgi:hypothetical protein
MTLQPTLQNYEMLGPVKHVERARIVASTRVMLEFVSDASRVEANALYERKLVP